MSDNAATTAKATTKATAKVEMEVGIGIPTLPPSQLCPLTREAIHAGLSNLGSTSRGLSLALLRVDLSNLQLTDVNLLASYTALQELDLHHNALVTLEPLRSLPHIVKLNVSGNQLSSPDALASCVPETLTELNLSRNQFLSLPSMRHLRYLGELRLDHNQLSTLAGVEYLPLLTTLSARHNALVSVDALGSSSASTCLTCLHLDHNHLEDVPALQRLSQRGAALQHISLAHNEVAHLDVLAECVHLLTLDLQANAVYELGEVSHLQPMLRLCELTLEDNPFYELPPPDDGGVDGGGANAQEGDEVLPDSGEGPQLAKVTVLGPTAREHHAALRAVLLERLPMLQRLNGVEVSSEEKVKAACNKKR